MKRGGSRPKPWKPRLSAGGANRTNLSRVMDRFRAPEVQALSPPSSRRPSASDLMPIPRTSSFRPFTSRFQPVYQPYYHEEPRYYPPGPPSLIPSYIPPQYPREYSSPKTRKKKHVPPKGMFQNAKYSDAPVIDEDQIRRTEEVITRMVERSHRKGYHHPNYAMRDSIRQAIYNMGVPENYRAAGTSEAYDEGPSRRHSRYSRGDERRYEDEVFEEEEEEEEKISSPRKKNRRRVMEEYEDEEEEPPRRVEKRRKRHVELEKEGNSSDEEEILMNKSRGSTKKSTPKRQEIPEERAPSRGSKSSRNESISPVSGPYIRDSDDDDNWRDSLDFMCQPNGAGAAMLERIGSAINPLPLRDDTTNSYSDVAMMILGKSLKTLKNPEIPPSVDLDLQSQILNRSTSWANKEKTRKADNSLMRDISRIQHPDNISTLQIDSTIFQAPRIKKPMPPPVHQSSPVSYDVFKPSKEMTAPSSIGPENYGICISDDEEDPKQFDIDDYIARGASQISYFPANPNISFDAPSSSNFFSPERDLLEEFENPFKTHSETTMNDFNSRFEFSPRRNKPPVDPILEIDESTQRMFDEVYESEKAEREKYLF